MSKEAEMKLPHRANQVAASSPRRGEDEGATVCPNPSCGESEQLAKVKGCIRCLRCGFKFDCNGW